MKNCYQIKEPQELFDYLKKLGRDAFHDWDYQLQTNYGFVHKLKNGQVAFFDNHFNQKAILFETEKCFEDVIKADRFPIDNPDRNMFDIEGERMLTFHLQSDHYRQHLNSVLKLSFSEITKETAQAYLKKVIGRLVKKLTKPTDVVALISVIGELAKQETNGKWFLVKRYGTYNPIYEPNILTENGNVILISSNIIGKVKWRISSLENIFIDVQSRLTEPIKWENYSKGKDNLIMIE